MIYSKSVHKKTLLTFLFILYHISAVYYLYWRFTYSINSSDWFFFPLLFCELFSITMTSIFLICTRSELDTSATIKKTNYSVDILIPTYNEPIDIVEKTMQAAAEVRGVQTIFLLDDGKRSELKTLSEKYGIRYLCRHTNAYAKAGNMNFGLSHSKSELVAFFDADHAPEPDFVEKTAGFFEDKKVAFVQTPQVFYNQHSFQFRENPYYKNWNEQSMFYQAIQPAKNAYNASFFCGSGGILRREALDSVGGFSTETATEDIHTSIKLHSKGYRSYFLNERLAYGIGPEDLAEYHKQRVRWGAGSLGLLFRSKDSPFVIKNLTFMQRLCYFHSTATYLNGIVKLFYMVLPIYILFFEVGAISTSTVQFFAVYIPFLLFSIATTYIFARHTYHPLYTEQYNLASMFAQIESLKGIVRIEKKFGVSLKRKSKKDNLYVSRLLLLLLIVMTGACISGVYRIVAHPLAGLENVLVIALFFNCTNMILIASFLRFLHVYNASQKQENVPSFYNLKLASDKLTRY